MADKKIIYEDDTMLVLVGDDCVVTIQSKLAKGVTVYASVEGDGFVEIASPTPLVITDEGAVRAIGK